MEEQHCSASVDSIGVARLLEAWYEGWYAHWVRTVENLPFELYLKSPCHFFKLACNVVIVIVGPVRQLITAIIQGRTVVRIDRFDAS